MTAAAGVEQQRRDSAGVQPERDGHERLIPVGDDDAADDGQVDGGDEVFAGTVAVDLTVQGGVLDAAGDQRERRFEDVAAWLGGLGCAED